MFGNSPAGGFSFSTASQPASSSSAPFSFANPSAPKNPTPLFNSFGARSATGTSTSPTTDMVAETNYVGDEDTDELYLEPPAFSAKDKAKWKASGRAWLAAASPVGGEIAGWITKQPSSDANKEATLSGDPSLTVSDRTVRLAAINNFAASEEKFYGSSYTLFSSLQKLVALSMRLPTSDTMGSVWDNNGNLLAVDGLLGPPAAETIIQMRRVVDYYLDDLNKMREVTDIDDDVKYRYETMYHIFNLAEILYLPADGRGEGLLGEELLDWGNQVDRIQINEQGNEIMAHKEPWEHMGFWPFIVRCLLRGFLLPAASFLRTLQTHPHPPIAKLGQIVERAVSRFPRSTNTSMYALDHQFVSAHKQWLAQFRADIAEFLGGRGNGHWFDADGISGRSQWIEWEDDFRSVTELLEGKKERLFAEAADWREALGAWGVLVDVSLRRDDLPGVVKRILNELPIDSTILEDSVQSSLCSSDIIEALMGCHDVDRWLAAHLGDVFDKLALVPDDEERFDNSLRDYYLLDYADMLQESPSQGELWEVIVEYLNSSGPEGRGRLRSYIVHVGTRLNETKGKEAVSPEVNSGMEVEGEEEATGTEGQLSHFKKLHETCVAFKLEEEWRTISTIVAERLMQQGDVGVAASICLLAEDGYTLSRIAEKILNAYVESGESEFLRLVDSLPSTMMQEAPQKFNELKLPEMDDEGTFAADSGRTIMVMFASRLAFLSEFRDYLIHLNQGSRDIAAKKLAQLLSAEITPVEFWAVLLAESVDLLEDDDILLNTADTFDLMRVVEDVLANAQFAPVDYLRQLWRYLARVDGAPEVANGTNGVAKSGGDRKREEVKEGTAAALRKLEVVRLALARNLSRALVVGTEGPF